MVAVLAALGAVLAGGSGDDAARACARAEAASAAGYALPGPCRLIASDTAADADPEPFYGHVECAAESRHRRPAAGGDPAPTALGEPQGDAAYRRLTVLDGDDFFGERCELGANRRDGPVAFYREGDRRLTYVSFRLPRSFPLGVFAWQGVMQMKQVQPADNGGGTPVLSLGAYDGRWFLFHSAAGKTDVDEVVWEAPAAKGVWTRFAFDVVYSQDPARGRIRVYADLNADRDFADPGEQSAEIRTNTLKRETGADDSDGLAAGESIPSHLRVGIYHDPAIACPPPSGCSVDVDDVQVLEP